MIITDEPNFEKLYIDATGRDPFIHIQYGTGSYYSGDYVNWLIDIILDRYLTITAYLTKEG